MTFDILFVCSANICRSPLAAALMSDYLGRTTDHVGIAVSSAGVHASRGSERCRQSADWLRSNLDSVPSHGSRRAVPGVTQDADLILVTDRDVHSTLLRSAPHLRSRSFTIREAVALGDAALTKRAPVVDPEDQILADEPGRRVPPAGPAVRLSQWVEDMNASRGLVTLGSPTPSRWFRRGPVTSPYDIPDAHSNERGWGHSRVLSLTHRSVAAVASQIIVLAEGSTAPPAKS